MYRKSTPLSSKCAAIREAKFVFLSQPLWLPVQIHVECFALKDASVPFVLQTNNPPACTL